MKKQVEKILREIKRLYLKYQTYPVIGMILFVIYMIFKFTFCYTQGICIL